MAPKAKQKAPKVRPHGATTAIIKELEALTYGRSAHQVFDDWLMVTEASLIMLPAHVRSMAVGEGMATDPPEYQDLWARLRKTYDQAGWQRLHRAFHLLLDSTGTGGDSGAMHFQDVIGAVFMEFGHPNEWSGQFFTPMPIAHMMVQMTLDAAEVERIVRERLRHAILQADQGGLLLMLWMMAQARNDSGLSMHTCFAEHIYPAIATTFQPYTIADPCSGSGVMLVAALEALSPWLTQMGLVQFHASDIDARCVRMAHINLMLYGAASYTVRHQNSLSLEPDFTPPRYGRVQWYTQAGVLLPQTSTPEGVPVLAEIPAAAASLAPPPAPRPDFTFKPKDVQQMTLDL